MSAQQSFDDLQVRRIGRCSPTSTSHIVAEPGARRALCGKRSEDGGVCWARFVQAHIDGHDPEWCESCLYLWSTT
jgi:hypothetical protein